MQNKYQILRLATNHYPIHGELTKVINYEDTRAIFLSKKESGKMEASVNMKNNTVYNVKDPEGADQATNKKYVDNQIEKKLDKVVDMDMKNHSIFNLKDVVPNRQDQAVNQKYVQSQLHTKLNKNADIDMTNCKIKNLGTPLSYENDAAVNVAFFNKEINDSNTNLYTRLTKDYKTYVNKSHINSPQKKDAFRYLMEDAGESSSENNINVSGINNFPESPHQINKKAYDLQLVLEKDSSNQYRSHLGFNLHPLPVGYYTMVVEWFPPEMNEVSVTPQATTISISDHTTKIFEKYIKTLIHFHRWDSSPPQFIYLDLHGTVCDTKSVNGHVIVYGIKETVSNVDPSIYDAAFTIENGQMVMQTDLSLKGHRLRNTAFAIENGQMVMQTDLSLNGHHLRDSVHYINGTLNTNKGDRFSLNGYPLIMIPKNSHILTITSYYFSNKRQYEPISLKIYHGQS